jgi:hypothetical protein
MLTKPSSSIPTTSRYVLHAFLSVAVPAHPTVQAYYRRASANTAILHHREALRDWRLVIKKAPHDATAKLRLAECDRIVKRDAFLKAIEVEDAPSAAEGLDIDSMIVEPSYDGVKLDKEMTLEFIEDMIERFKNGKKIARKYVFQIILAVMDLVKKEPTMVEVDVEDGHEITVCGDTHGMFYDTDCGQLHTDRGRSILRSTQHFQACWQSYREALFPVQWRLRRPWVVVHRGSPHPVRLQVALPHQVLPQPWQPRDGRHEPHVRL